MRRELLAPFFEDAGEYKTLSALRAADEAFDLQWVRLAEGSRVLSRSIGGLDIRKETGASIVGVIRGEQLVANPDAAFRFEAGDLVAIIGTDEARRAFQGMIEPG